MPTMPHQYKKLCDNWYLSIFNRLLISTPDVYKRQLWVSVNQKDFLPRLSQTNSKIGTSVCFADTTFLVGYGNNLCIHDFTSFLSKFRYEKSACSTFPGKDKTGTFTGSIPVSYTHL